MRGTAPSLAPWRRRRPNSRHLRRTTSPSWRRARCDPSRHRPRGLDLEARQGLDRGRSLAPSACRSAWPPPGRRPSRPSGSNCSTPSSSRASVPATARPSRPSSTPGSSSTRASTSEFFTRGGAQLRSGRAGTGAGLAAGVDRPRSGGRRPRRRVRALRRSVAVDGERAHAAGPAPRRGGGASGGSRRGGALRPRRPTPPPPLEPEPLGRRWLRPVATAAAALVRDPRVASSPPRQRRRR